MKTLITVGYFRKDLKDEFLKIEFSKIEWLMLSISGTGVTFGEDLSVFIDDDGSTKILRNRFGMTQNP
jgi:hypothetical protein